MRIPEHTYFREVGGEAVLLNIKTGQYFALDGVGTRVWAMLEAGASQSDAVQTIVAEYDVEEERARSDIDELVAELMSHGLVEDDSAT